jgi:hypothetical protein
VKNGEINQFAGHVFESGSEGGHRSHDLPNEQRAASGAGEGIRCVYGFAGRCSLGRS